LKTQVRKLVKIIALLTAIVWWPTVSHCLMENAGWVASDRCCSESADGSQDSQPSHDECSGCFFESSGMLLAKSHTKVSAVQLEPLDFDFAPVPDLLRSPADLDCTLLDFGTCAGFHQLALPRICPIRGPSLLA
jgi:hypothetical protein